MDIETFSYSSSADESYFNSDEENEDKPLNHSPDRREISSVYRIETSDKLDNFVYPLEEDEDSLDDGICRNISDSLSQADPSLEEGSSEQYSQNISKKGEVVHTTICTEKTEKVTVTFEQVEIKKDMVEKTEESEALSDEDLDPIVIQKLLSNVSKKKDTPKVEKKVSRRLVRRKSRVTHSIKEPLKEVYIDLQSPDVPKEASQPEAKEEAKIDTQSPELPKEESVGSSPLDTMFSSQDQPKKIGTYD